MKKEFIYIGSMKWKQPVVNLNKDDYSLPEELDKEGKCRSCNEFPMLNGEKSYKCVIDDSDLKDDMVACGLGHICYDCWDDLKEVKNEI